MKLDWLKDSVMRARVGDDLLLWGNAFVVENDDGTRQRRISPDAVRVIVDKKGKPNCYEVGDGRHVSLYKPKIYGMVALSIFPHRKMNRRKT